LGKEGEKELEAIWFRGGGKEEEIFHLGKKRPFLIIVLNAEKRGKEGDTRQGERKGGYFQEKKKKKSEYLERKKKSKLERRGRKGKGGGGKVSEDMEGEEEQLWVGKRKGGRSLSA